MIFEASNGCGLQEAIAAALSSNCDKVLLHGQVLQITVHYKEISSLVEPETQDELKRIYFAP